MAPSRGPWPIALAVLLVVPAVALVVAPASSAATWTEITTGAPEDITAVEYQSADRLWFTTNNGHIYKVVGGTAQLKGTAPALTVFNDIEFQTSGQVGFAVGTGGVVMRSANGGDAWAQVALPVGGRQTDVNRCDLTDQGAGDLDSVTLDGDARAWITGGGTQIYRTVDPATSSNVGENAGAWLYVNDNGADCKITQDVDDVFPVAGTTSVFFVAKSFGGAWLSSNDLIAPAVKKAGSAGNGFDELRRLAGDPANPNRQWAVTPGSGPSYVGRTTDGWSTEMQKRRRRPGPTFNNMYDVDYAGGTVMLVGDGGRIATSLDGGAFTFQPAGGGLATVPWRAVSLAAAPRRRSAASAAGWR